MLFSELNIFLELRNFMTFENKNFRKKINCRKCQMYCLQNDWGDLVGMIAAYMNRVPLCYVNHVIVRPNYRWYGLFNVTYMVLEQKAWLSGFREIKLEV